MPHFHIQGNTFSISPDGGPEAYSANLSKALANLNYNNNSAFADVTFHCNNKSTFKVNKLVLAFSSKLLGPIFQTSCDLTSFLPVTYDILCPGFEPQALQKVLEILYTGKTFINSKDARLYRDMRSILDQLQISMTLNDKVFGSPNYKPDPDVILVPTSEGLTSLDLDTGSTGSDSNQGSFGSNSNQRLTGSDLNQGSTGTDLNQGLTGSDLNQGSFGSDTNQGSTGSDSNQRSFGLDSNQGSTGSDSNLGLTGSDSNQGLTGSEPEVEQPLRIKNVFQPFVCNYCNKEFQYYNQVKFINKLDFYQYKCIRAFTI
jgi:hypothetical protein